MWIMTAISVVCSNKNAERQRILALRHAMSVAERAIASADICAQLRKLSALAQARCVAAFAPMSEEVNIWPLLDEWRNAGKRVALPRMGGARQLTFHAVADARRLQKGAKNILEPSLDSPIIAPQMFDFAIIPAVAIDKQFFRLGYGGGFYDTFITGLADAVTTCALVFRCQRICQVPTETHDKRVNMVISERIIG